MRPSLKTRVTGAFTLIFFAFTNLVPPGFGGIELSAPEGVPVTHPKLFLPADLGTVEESYVGQQGRPVIFHLQTAHGDAGIQRKIKEILLYLHQTQGAPILFAEGASEKLHPEILRFFPDAARNGRMSDLLLEKGLYTGVDLFFLEPGAGKVEGVGIEKSRLYRLAYQALQKVLRESPAAGLLLKKEKMKLDREAQSVLPKDLMELVRRHQKFEDHQISFLPYAGHLLENAARFLQMDFKTPFLQPDWPQTVRLAVIQELERGLDKQKLEEERIKIHTSFRGGIPGAAEAISGNGLRPDNLRFYFERFLKEARPLGFRLEDYPHFSRWAGLQVLQKELDARALSGEMEKLRRTLEASLTKTEAQQQILKRYDNLSLLKKLLRLELDRGEWEEIKAYSVERIADRKRQNRNGPEFLSAIRYPLHTAFRFYRLVERRDHVFFETLQRELKAGGQEKALLVTGGFHTEGLKELFRRHGFSYAVLSPRITGEVTDGVYRKSMLDLAQIETVELAQRAGTRAAQGRDLKVEAKEIRDAFKSIAGVQDWRSGWQKAAYRRDLASLALRRAEVRADTRKDKEVQQMVQQIMK